MKAITVISNVGGFNRAILDKVLEALRRADIQDSSGCLISDSFTISTGLASALEEVFQESKTYLGEYVKNAIIIPMESFATKEELRDDDESYFFIKSVVVIDGEYRGVNITVDFDSLTDVDDDSGECLYSELRLCEIFIPSHIHLEELFQNIKTVGFSSR